MSRFIVFFATIVVVGCATSPKQAPSRKEIILVHDHYTAWIKNGNQVLAKTVEGYGTVGTIVMKFGTEVGWSVAIWNMADPYRIKLRQRRTGDLYTLQCTEKRQKDHLFHCWSDSSVPIKKGVQNQSSKVELVIQHDKQAAMVLVRYDGGEESIIGPNPDPDGETSVMFEPDPLSPWAGMFLLDGGGQIRFSPGYTWLQMGSNVYECTSIPNPEGLYTCIKKRHLDFLEKGIKKKKPNLE